MTETAQTETKATRGEGLVKTAFVNAEGNDHKRVPKGVLAVIVNGKSYALSQLSQEVKDELVAFAVSTRIKTYVNNHADEAKKGEDVPALADQVFADLVAGKLYAATSEGGKAVKPFDSQIYLDAVKIGSQERNKVDPSKPVISEAQLAQLKTKIEVDLSGKERVAYLARIKADPYAGAAYKVLQARAQMEKNKANAGKDEKKESVLDLF